MGICEDAPDEYCGHVLEPEDAGVDREVPHWHENNRNAVCLRRPKYDGLCVWHADTDEKTAEELVEARLTPEDVPWETKYVKEHLSGAILRGKEFPEGFSFGGCVLVSTEFPDAYLYGAEFPDAYLSYAEFPDADLLEAEFPDADLLEAEFPDADLRYAEFPDAYLLGAEFPNANLSKAEFPRAHLYKAEFPRAHLSDAKFRETNLRRINLTEANLQETEFSEADLRDAMFRPAYARVVEPEKVAPTDPLGASLEDAQLEDGTDLRGADLSGARLYQTAFRDVRINDGTQFGLEDGNYGEKCRYDYDPNTGVSINDETDDNTSRLEAAAWTYRRLESLFEENAMDERARNAHIRKEEARRAKYEEQIQDDWPPIRAAVQAYHQVTSRITLPRFPRLRAVSGWTVSRLNWHLHRHGESLRQLLKISALFIIGCGLLYPFIGGINSTNSGGPYRITSLNEFVGLEAWVDIANGLYFSAITFTTIGYGDFYPAGTGSRILVALESLGGALLIALFVFVIGRRVAR
jgi:uncharacterized protein YjbI with pentapeptide repeats